MFMDGSAMPGPSALRGLAARQQRLEQRLVSLTRLLLVQPRQGAPHDRPNAKMLELFAAWAETSLDVPQTAAVGKLRPPERHELRPARAAAQPLPFVIPIRQSLELMSPNPFQRLPEYRTYDVPRPRTSQFSSVLFALAWYQPSEVSYEPTRRCYSS
jgi:hypothetical protein